MPVFVKESKIKLIKLTLLKEPKKKKKNEETLFKVIKAAFMQKRKTLSNALCNGKILESKEKVDLMLNELNIDLKIRGEKLTLEQFAQISDYIE